MNKVGAGGKGESVWLAWFLRTVLQQFAPLVDRRGDAERAAMYRAEAERLLQAIEQEAWDGQWYRRAYFDDGTPLGSRMNDECQIDSLTQSWSVMGGGDRQRGEVAMRAVEKHLVPTDERLVLLLTPPFNKTILEPGYIKGYPPGIRENGGQYTHAANWVIQALTQQGKGSRAMRLFDLLNPILSATPPAAATKYRVEPYVVAADVYSASPHVGRGGWTWYTGSAAWMYRVAIESMLGIELRGDRLTVNPCIPADWPGFEVIVRRGKSTWSIRVANPFRAEHGVKQITVDDQRVTDGMIQLLDDGREHLIEVLLGPCDDSKAGGSTMIKVNGSEPPPGKIKTALGNLRVAPISYPP